MKIVSGKRLCRVLERHGWSPVRIRGSHHAYQKPGHAVTITVPVHSNKDLKPGTQRANHERRRPYRRRPVTHAESRQQDVRRFNGRPRCTDARACPNAPLRKPIIQHHLVARPPTHSTPRRS